MKLLTCKHSLSCIGSPVHTDGPENLLLHLQDLKGIWIPFRTPAMPSPEEWVVRLVCLWSPWIEDEACSLVRKFLFCERSPEMLHTANWGVSWVSVVGVSMGPPLAVPAVGGTMAVFSTLVWPAWCWLSGLESLLVPWRLGSTVGWQNPSAMPSLEGGCLLLLHKDLASSWSSDRTGELA